MAQAENVRNCIEKLQQENRELTLGKEARVKAIKLDKIWYNINGY